MFPYFEKDSMGQFPDSERKLSEIKMPPWNVRFGFDSLLSKDESHQRTHQAFRINRAQSSEVPKLNLSIQTRLRLQFELGARSSSG
jgi:hypothetical protein